MSSTVVIQLDHTPSPSFSSGDEHVATEVFVLALLVFAVSVMAFMGCVVIFVLIRRDRACYSCIHRMLCCNREFTTQMAVDELHQYESMDLEEGAEMDDKEEHKD